MRGAPSRVRVMQYRLLALLALRGARAFVAVHPQTVPPLRLAAAEGNWDVPDDELRADDGGLYATGAATVLVGLEAPGVQLDGKGRVVVDEKQATLPRDFLDTS